MKARSTVNVKIVAAQSALQALRQVEAIQRQDAAFLRVNDEEAIIATAFGHREHPAPVAGDEVFWAKGLHAAR